MLLNTDVNLLNDARLALGLPILNLTGLTLTQLSQEFANTRNLAINFVNANNGLLPAIPFPEIHPYPPKYPFNPDYNISIVGTFPPVSYLLDNPNVGVPNLTPVRGRTIFSPEIPFYHGNRASLWDLLGVPFNNGNRLVYRASIIAWLNQNRINYFDIISECQRRPKSTKGNWVDYSTDDDALHNIMPNHDTFNDWFNNLNEDSLIVFNTSSAYGKNGLGYTWGNFKPAIKAFDIFLHTAMQNHNVHLSMDRVVWYSVNLNQNAVRQIWKNKVIFYLKI